MGDNDNERNDTRDDMRMPTQEGFNKHEFDQGRPETIPEQGFSVIHPDLAGVAEAAAAANLLSTDEESDATPVPDEEQD